MLSKELRDITDRVFINRVENANKVIIEQLYEAAEKELSEVIYPKILVSQDFIVYLNNQGFKVYGRRNLNDSWHRIWSSDDYLSVYSDILIKW